MVNPPARRPWWLHRGPFIALGLHALLFLGFFQLHFTHGEWVRMDRTLPEKPTTAEWIDAIKAQHGYWGLVIWYFDCHGEIRLYHRYAQVALRGIDPWLPADAPNQRQLSPYRDVPVEYQPGALLVLVPPALLTTDAAEYQFWFVAWCGVLYVGAIILGLKVLAHGSPISPATATRALGWSVAFLLAFGPVAAARFDHAVALVCLAGAALFQRGARTGGPAWFAACGAVIAMGVMVKIVPGMLLPAGLLWLLALRPQPQWRPAFALAIGFAVSLVALHAAFVATWGEGYLRSFTYHVDRGLQIETTFAGILLAGNGFGAPLRIDRAFSAFDLATPYSDVLVAAAPIFFLLLAAIVAGRIWGARHLIPEARAGLAVVLLTFAFLLAFILTNKVLSPQYLLWLAPLAAVAYAARPALWPAAVALLVAAGLSQAIFPRLYDWLLNVHWLPVLLLNLRNLMLAVIFVWLVARLPVLLKGDAHRED